MKVIFSVIIILIKINSFAQENYTLKLIPNNFIINKLTKGINNKTDLTSVNSNMNVYTTTKQNKETSYVLQSNKIHPVTIDFNINKRRCQFGLMLFAAPIAGIIASDASYNSFKEGDKAAGYIIAGVSAFLIIAPISYIIYCRNHNWYI